MSDSTTYNGYKNYETWAVGLYLDGNYTGEGTYLEVLDVSRGFAGDVNGLADALKDLCAEEGPETGLAADLFGAALSSVDWHELAQLKLAEVAEEQN